MIPSVYRPALQAHLPVGIFRPASHPGNDHRPILADPTAVVAERTPKALLSRRCVASAGLRGTARPIFCRPSLENQACHLPGASPAGSTSCLACPTGDERATHSCARMPTAHQSRFADDHPPDGRRAARQTTIWLRLPLSELGMTLLIAGKLTMMDLMLALRTHPNLSALIHIGYVAKFLDLNRTRRLAQC